MRSPGGTGGERGIGRSKGRKQKEEKQKKLEIKGEKRDREGREYEFDGNSQRG